MHLGRGNLKYSYFMENGRLEVVAKERDLGVVVSNDLKASNQYRTAYNKAMRTLGMMNRTILYKKQGHTSETL